MFLVTPIARAIQDAGIFSWDFGLTLINFVTPSREVEHVTPAGHPGEGGKWPEYIPPKEGDSRCSCPALNAMANHGILPRDGKNISFPEMNSTIRATYNFGPSFCFFVPNFAARMLKKSYGKDRFDLADLDFHNGIEHDASLTREDIHFVKDQGKPHLPFVRELLDSASGKDKEGNVLLTLADLSRYSSKRRAESRANNPEFSLDLFHKMFGSSNSSTLLTIFGGRVSDLESILIDERLPEGWESRIRKPFGLTIASFQPTVLKVEFGIDESKYAAEASSTAAAESGKPNPAA
ncbi:hypothetical protein K443DRAFT_680585 [Laccaria amethystina LaAM-08-1]|uniref:Unplaced genomic scaffold K443scaffold_129, whole genome shotgun sequence n=1 Tax=Laccaria amethystina LaAM-08-1 TaxID=1095629 RepID=A0A0C9XMA7_9AGAR|nr:hypothetical protein K443DRAFT_680585 [Laccaria amethystina LaAM-08-1]